MSTSQRLHGNAEDSTDDAPLSPKDPYVAAESSGVVSRTDFGPRYQVLRAIARGGMGDVYLAYDTQLSRQVALKVLRPDRIEHGWALARFRREVALASRVTHENVLRVFDLGEAGLWPYLSMPYVEGEDLGTLVEREHPLPVDRTLRLFRQIALGVAAAHDQGVIHRDLKPSNILIDRDDHVFVADFGVARALEDPTITVTGALIGSPAYLSPEQVRGEPADERSDVYALGIILYEMLTGGIPFSGDSAHAVMEQRLHRKPRPVRALRPDVPAHLEKVIAKTLSVSPRHRYATVRALASDLDAPAGGRSATRRILVAVAAAGAALAAAAALVRPHANGVGPVARSSPSGSLAKQAGRGVGAPPLTKVLILGIENRTADPVFDRTPDTILFFALRRSPTLEPWNGGELRRLALDVDSSNPALDDALTAKVAARDGVRVVGVKGSVALNGARLSIDASVEEAGAILLSRRVEAEESELVPELGRLAREIRTSLGEALPDAPDDAEETGTSRSLEAVYEYTTANEISNSGKIVDSLPHYERAVTLDPGFALAHGDFAVELSNVGRWGRVLEEDERAVASADRLDPRSRLQLVGSAASHRGDYGAAEQAFAELLSRWPDDQPAETNLACAYISEGDFDRAAPLVSKLASEHPRDVIVRSNVSSVELGLGDFEAVVRTDESVLHDFTNPPPSTYSELALAYWQLGRAEEANATLEKLAAVDAPEAAVVLADLSIASGRLREATAGLEQALGAGIDHDDVNGAAAKRALLASARMLRGDRTGAVLAAKQAAAWAEFPSTLLVAGLAELDAGDVEATMSVTARLAKLSTPGANSCGKLLQAEELRAAGRPREAVALLDALRRDESFWLVHYLLARSYLDAGRPSEAAAELELFVSRAGRAMEGYGDGSPTARFLPKAMYDLGRAREAAGDPRASDAYATFLATQSQADSYPILEDARRRLDALRKPRSPR